MLIPEDTHLFPISFTALKIIIRSLRLTASSAEKELRQGHYELANYLENQLNEAIAKEKANAADLQRRREEKIKSIKRHLDN